MKYLWLVFLVGLSATAYALTGISPPVNLAITITGSPPSATLSANPTSVASGSSSTLTWGSTNASSCVSPGSLGNTAIPSFSGATSGSQSTGALTTTTTYSVQCATATASAAVTVTGGGLTAPAQAANANFSTLAYNYDFSQPQYGNPTTNWIDCGYPPTDSTKVWHQGSPGVDSNRCDATVFSQTVDQGFTVLDERWLSSDDGRSNHFNSIETVCCGHGNVGLNPPGAGTQVYPNFYMETVARITPQADNQGNGNTSGPDAVWTWQTGGSDWEWDTYEIFAAPVFGDECGGGCTWVSYNSGIGGNQNIPSGWSPLNYHKYGMLVTTDGVNHTYGCGWIDDVFQSCFDRGISNFPQWTIAWVGGPGVNTTQLPTTDEYIQYIRIWSCAAWATTQCNGSTLSSSTVNGTTLNYYH